MNKYQQLKFNIKREEIIEKYSFEDYDWLTGDPRSLIIFFNEKIDSNPEDKKLINYCLKRIEIEKNNESLGFI